MNQVFPIPDLLDPGKARLVLYQSSKFVHIALDKAAIPSTGAVNLTLTAEGDNFIELGQPGGGTPYIDFHAGVSDVDYDARIQAKTGTGIAGEGQLDIYAKPLNLIKGQLKFPATANLSSDANTIDDYEEGTWTPGWQGSTAAGTITYTVRQGFYMKLGRTVFITWTLLINAVSVAPTGSVSITGLPFTKGTGMDYNSGDIGYITVAPASSTCFGAMVDGGFPIAATTQVRISYGTSAGGLTQPIPAASIAASQWCMGSAFYKTDV